MHQFGKLVRNYCWRTNRCCKEGFIYSSNLYNDVLTITIGGTTKTATIRGRRAVNVNSTEVLAISDSTALKFIMVMVFLLIGIIK